MGGGCPIQYEYEYSIRSTRTSTVLVHRYGQYSVPGTVGYSTCTGTEVTMTPADVGAGSSSSSGNRKVINSSTVKVYDSSGTLRVTLGDLS